mmetsp:Transcript_13922/g.26603  ORF Transcript_13922/g.26603 Transcript_13922/m.26603 type:complete len:113 (-) Transcript_13922:97-435(-)
MVCIIAKSPFVILKVVGGTEGGAESVVPIAGGECLQKRGAPLPRWLSNGTGTASPPHLHKHPFEALPQQHVLESQLLQCRHLLCRRDNLAASRRLVSRARYALDIVSNFFVY